MRTDTTVAVILSIAALALPPSPLPAGAGGPSSKWVKGLDAIGLRGLPEGLALAVTLRNVRKEPLQTKVAFRAPEGGSN